MAIHSRILASEISRTEDPGGLQSMGLQRVRHNLATKQQPKIRQMTCRGTIITLTVAQ